MDSVKVSSSIGQIDFKLSFQSGGQNLAGEGRKKTNEVGGIGHVFFSREQAESCLQSSIEDCPIISEYIQNPYSYLLQTVADKSCLV